MYYFSLYSNKIILKKNNSNGIPFYCYIKKLISSIHSFIDNFFIDFLLDFIYKNISEIYFLFFLNIQNFVEGTNGSRFGLFLNSLNSFFNFFFKPKLNPSLSVKNKLYIFINFNIKDKSLVYNNIGKFIITNNIYYQKNRQAYLFISKFNNHCKNSKIIKETNLNLNNYGNFYLIFKTLNSYNYLADEKIKSSFLINLYFKNIFLYTNILTRFKNTNLITNKKVTSTYTESCDFFSNNTWADNRKYFWDMWFYYFYKNYTLFKNKNAIRWFIYKLNTDMLNLKK